jgi:hydrogenase expression/formation protein HypC
MCLGVPYKVIAVNKAAAQLTVQAFGKEKTVSSLMLIEAVTVNDYVLVQVGNFASEVLNAQQAEEALMLLDKLEITSHVR